MKTLVPITTNEVSTTNKGTGEISSNEEISN